MLYDPKWDVQTKPDYSLNSLISWMETKDASETYDILLPWKCLLGQFVQHVGGKLVSQLSNNLAEDKIFSHIAFGRFSEGPFTFGDALRRARAVS
jgi:hypothetical protein